MFSADRFRSLLTEKRLSQSELARRVGVSQASIYRLAKGDAYGSKHLHRIARELGTTPAFLTGETDRPDEDAPAAQPLDSDTRELNDHFAEMTPADRRAVLQIVRSMSGHGGTSDTVHATKTKFKGQSE